MAAAKKLDDPNHINAFLAMIGGSPIAPRVVKSVQSDQNNQRARNDEVCTGRREPKAGLDNIPQAMTKVNDENKKPFCDENVSRSVQ